MTLEAALRIRKLIEQAVQSLTDAEKSECVTLHRAWTQDGHYTAGEVVRRGGKLYKCLIEHDAQQTWTPEDSPSLWARVMYRDGIRIIPDTITATEAFSMGEKGWWGDALYQSTFNGNVYTPAQYPAGWELLEG